jgi:hypothetical protein
MAKKSAREEGIREGRKEEKIAIAKNLDMNIFIFIRQ